MAKATKKTTQHSPSSAPHRDRVAVVVNGNAKHVTEDLVTILDEIIHSGDLFVSRSLEEGQEIATRIVAQGYSTVLTGGGDGTFTQMVTWIVAACHEKNLPYPRFGLLRLGTGNALAWVLGANKARGRGLYADLARLRTSAGHSDLRLIEVNGKLSPFAGLGTDALALKHFNEVKASFAKVPVLRRYGTGLLAYAVGIAGRTSPQLLVKPMFHVRVFNAGEPAYRLGKDGEVLGEPVQKGELLFEGKTRGVCMSSIPYWGFGVRIFPFATDYENRFSLRVVNIGPVAVALNLRSIWKGTYRDPRVHDFAVDRVRVETTEPQPLQIGGDPAGVMQTFEAGLYPDKIPVVDYYAPPPVE